MEDRNRDEANFRRTVMLTRQEGEEPSEVGRKLGESSFTELKREKGLKKKIRMSFAWLSSQEVKR